MKNVTNRIFQEVRQKKSPVQKVEQGFFVSGVLV